MFEDFDYAEERAHLRGDAGEDGPTILDDETLNDVMRSQMVMDHDASGDIRFGYTHEADAVRKMAPAVKAVQELARKPDPLSTMRPGTARQPQVLKIDSPMREIYRAAAVYLDARHCFTMHRLSPYLQAIVDVVDTLELDYLPPIGQLEFVPTQDAQSLLSVLFRMEQELREKARSGVLATRAASIRRKENKNYQSAKRLFEACSTCSSKLVSIRMDLLFHPSSIMRMTPRTKEDRLWLARHLKNLILKHREAVKRRFKRGLLGWLYKIEFGASSGFHVHCWFLFNHHLHRLQMPLCKFIEDQWVAVTMREGYGRRVKPTDHFKNAVGLLDLDLPKVQAGIHQILLYVTKGDELIALELEDGSKTFMRSRLPFPRGPGRPRTTPVADYGYTNRRGDVLPGSELCTSLSALNRQGPESHCAEAQTSTKEKDPRKGGRPENPPQTKGRRFKTVFSEKTLRFRRKWMPGEPSQPPVSF
jgi:hypothetical protein